MVLNLVAIHAQWSKNWFVRFYLCTKFWHFATLLECWHKTFLWSSWYTLPKPQHALSVQSVLKRQHCQTTCMERHCSKVRFLHLLLATAWLWLAKIGHFWGWINCYFNCTTILQLNIHFNSGGNIRPNSDVTGKNALMEGNSMYREVRWFKGFHPTHPFIFTPQK